MSALIGADAAETLCVLKVFDMLLDRTAGNAKRRDHSSKSQLRIPREEIKNTVLGFARNKSDRWDNTLRDGRDPVPVESIAIPGSEGSLNVFPLWEDEPGTCGLEHGMLTIEGLKYGLIFRIEKT